MEIYLTNLGKYNEGYLVGEWVHLPVSADDLKGVLDRIGINKEYEEFFITDYECDYIKIHEFDSLSSLNMIAEKMESLSSTEKILFEYFLNYENLGVSEAIQELEKENYFYYEEIEDDYDLGLAVSEGWTIPEYLASYIDYEAIGRDFTCSGWVLYGGLAICR